MFSSAWGILLSPLTSNNQYDLSNSSWMTSCMASIDSASHLYSSLWQGWRTMCQRFAVISVWHTQSWRGEEHTHCNVIYIWLPSFVVVLIQSSFTNCESSMDGKGKPGWWSGRCHEGLVNVIHGWDDGGQVGCYVLSFVLLLFLFSSLSPDPLSHDHLTTFHLTLILGTNVPVFPLFSILGLPLTCIDSLWLPSRPLSLTWLILIPPDSYVSLFPQLGRTIISSSLFSALSCLVMVAALKCI